MTWSRSCCLSKAVWNHDSADIGQTDLIFCWESVNERAINVILLFCTTFGYFNKQSQILTNSSVDFPSLNGIWNFYQTTWYQGLTNPVCRFWTLVTVYKCSCEKCKTCPIQACLFRFVIYYHPGILAPHKWSNLKCGTTIDHDDQIWHL